MCIHTCECTISIGNSHQHQKKNPSSPITHLKEPSIFTFICLLGLSLKSPGVFLFCFGFYRNLSQREKKIKRMKQKLKKKRHKIIVSTQLHRPALMPHLSSLCGRGHPRVVNFPLPKLICRSPLLFNFHCSFNLLVLGSPCGTHWVR